MLDPAVTVLITRSEPLTAMGGLRVPVLGLVGKYSVNSVMPLYARHSAGYCFARYEVNCAVEPEPSECTTTMIGSDGSFVPLLSAVICASFQLVICPKKILARVSPDNRMLRTSWPPTRTW
ncbi:hypothetical protein GCM10027610_085170 [Dactylosporangium cerinum]